MDRTHQETAEPKREFSDTSSFKSSSRQTIPPPQEPRRNLQNMKHANLQMLGIPLEVFASNFYDSVSVEAVQQNITSVPVYVVAVLTILLVITQAGRNAFIFTNNFSDGRQLKAYCSLKKVGRQLKNFELWPAAPLCHGVLPECIVKHEKSYPKYYSSMHCNNDLSVLAPDRSREDLCSIPEMRLGCAVEVTSPGLKH
ncbi:hypothetical protein CEXT_410531 [Caerostris extrusa]|uniref:Uncharacterized protein n=1 Tax=Caerostris extrusa TaxID=172846 RepID=A0AAV4RUI6_CAEEX|nr:hypothetical protein CEXT_410531 [Caerostris extrusa]